MNDRYSARNGYIEDQPERQADDLDSTTRNALWNVIAAEVGRSVNPLVAWTPVGQLSTTAGSIIAQASAMLGPKTIRLLPFVQRLWVEHWDDRPSEVATEAEQNLIADVEHVVVDGDLPEIFDVVEILVESVSQRDEADGDELVANVNRVFLRKNAAFRIVDGLVLPLSNEIERQAVEKALSDASHVEGPREQLELAARHIRAGNWATSVSTAINAAEGTARSVLRDNKITLGAAVEKLKGQKRVDNDVAAAWTRLYAYASNAGNIRHGGIYAANVSPELATYFLVTTSAFVSYLLSLPADDATDASSPR